MFFFITPYRHESVEHFSQLLWLWTRKSVVEWKVDDCFSSLWAKKKFSSSQWCQWFGIFLEEILSGLTSYGWNSWDWQIWQRPTRKPWNFPLAMAKQLQERKHFTAIFSSLFQSCALISILINKTVNSLECRKLEKSLTKISTRKRKIEQWRFLLHKVV